MVTPCARHELNNLIGVAHQALKLATGRRRYQQMHMDR